jgi:hypothetical protein
MLGTATLNKHGADGRAYGLASGDPTVKKSAVLQCAALPFKVTSMHSSGYACLAQIREDK